MVNYLNNSYCDPRETIPSEAVNEQNKYRYFNQPIEQIPGFNSSQPQVLCHSPEPYVGLFWASLECYSPVDCIDLQKTSLVATKKSIGVFKIFDSNDVCSVPLAYCSGDTPPPTDTPTATPTATPTPTPTVPADDNPMDPVPADPETGSCPIGFDCMYINPSTDLCVCCPSGWYICTAGGNPAYGMCVPPGYRCTSISI